MIEILQQHSGLVRPEWLDKTEYPFASHTMTFDAATHTVISKSASVLVSQQTYRLHYIDEGAGDVLLFVHGTPVWSFLYRHCIKHFSKGFRCIALDHLGFGLSDKPGDGDYSPKAHAERLSAFVQELGLENITLITQDYGGPIALDAASRFPERISRLVIANSWMWLVPRLEQGGKLFNTPLGKWLYLRYGFSAKVMIPQAFGDRALLTSHIFKHYLQPLRTKTERLGTFALVQSMATGQQWYHGIQERIHLLRDKPVLMLWGMKDKFVPYDVFMPLWNKTFTNMQIVEIPEAGHFVEEEAPERVISAMRKFLQEA